MVTRFDARTARTWVKIRPQQIERQQCLSVVMPCYNERETIREVVARVLESPFTAELVIVDDGSTDGTRDILASFDDPRVRVVLQPTNRGKGAALRRGFREATAELVIVQDADLEYNPADYAVVLQPLIDGRADAVYGSRFHTSRPHRVLYYWHSVGNKFLTFASNAFTNLNLTDMETCYKAFRREVIQSIDVEEDRFGFEPEITAKLAAGRFVIYEVGVSYDGRTYEEGKKIGWRDGVRAIYCIARYSGPGRRLAGTDRVHDAPHDDDANRNRARALDALDGATNHVDWVFGLIEPHVKGEVVELGAGVGTMTARLADLGPVTAVEASPDVAARLEQRFGNDPRVSVRNGDHTSLAPESADTIVIGHALAQVLDDEGALRSLHSALRPGGRIVVYAPAFDALYSRHDRQVGHHRRYRARTLASKMRSAGLDMVECRYVDAVGALGWLAYARVLRRDPTGRHAVRLHDRVVVRGGRRLEARWQVPVGRSVLCVAERS
jgi:SAM-dependent methyltransferase